MKLSLLLIAILAIVASQEIVPDALYSEKQETFTAVGTLQLNCTANGPSSPFGIQSILYDAANLSQQEGIYNGLFTATDGSFTRVLATLNSSDVSVPTGSALPNFLAYSLRTAGSGDLNKISFITRYNTVGGVFNATQPCNSTFEGQTFTFDFRATYGFYESKEPSTAGRNVIKRATYRAVGTLSINCSTPTVQSGIQSTMTNVDGGASVGTYNGTFVQNDGSFTRVVPPLLATANPTGGNALPYFLANSLNNIGTGQLSNIVFITRFDTVGGVLNATACTGAPAGTVITGIPFEASYGFYAVPQDSTGSSQSTSATSTTGAGSILTFSTLLIAVAALFI